MKNEEKENENENEMKSQWKLLCEMKIKNENKKNEMELKYEWNWVESYSLRMRACFYQHLFFTPYTNTLTFQTGEEPSNLKSVILTPSEEQILTSYLPNKKNNKLTLLYRGSRDGFAAKTFHEKCDNQGPTICIILSNYNHVFGGFTNISWTSSDEGEHKNDAEAFLYLLRSSNASQPSEKWMVKPDMAEYAIGHLSSYGPIFGGGHDMCIVDNCNSTNSNSNLGHSYNVSSDQNKLAGACNFSVKEYEVYKVE